ncbi:MAG TPA: molybdopterin cofactor-binding domain-containing protein, partial [Alphaproteobacteria bacterium]|nr:molybdopterin cofactor-binding domain-containing protein [Alphaproteobacteria bacterium]
LGCPIEDIDIVEGDTDRQPFGIGTFASRSMTLAGAAIVRSTDKIIAKARALAAHLLRCAVEEIAYEDGYFIRRGTNQGLSFQDVAKAAYTGADYPEGFELGLEETSFFDPADYNYPTSIHFCTVVVDTETGKVSLKSYGSVEDHGRVINPMIVDGQLHGGAAQGIGQALMETCVFDPETGQPLTGSFMDYCLPRADDLPSFKVVTQETLSPGNPLGVKGAGESGTIGAPATVANAVVDALWHLGVRHIDMPLTPQRVWQAIQRATARQ